MNLFSEFYLSDNKKRRIELENTIRMNVEFDFIDNYWLFTTNENIQHLEKIIAKCENKKKIHIIKIKDRCLYQEMFNKSNEVTTPDDINILINNDITLTNTVSFVQKINHDDFYCLTRWENLDNRAHREKINGVGYDSQDCWIWRGYCKIKDANFYMGVPGCDNVIGYLAAKYYYVLNPSIDIITIHNHFGNHRTYTDEDRLPRPYMFIRPHKLNENEKLKENQTKGLLYDQNLHFLYNKP